MKKGYIDSKNKAKFLNIRPKFYQISEEKTFVVFPQNMGDNRIKKAMKKHNVELITEVVDLDFINRLYFKTIIQTMKENNSTDVVLCFKELTEVYLLIKMMLEREITFKIFDCPDSEQIQDYFLNKYGISISFTAKVKSGLLVYISGEEPNCDDNVLKLDFSGKLNGTRIMVKEYKIKDMNFPIIIDNTVLLFNALDLTEKKLSDIIIKLCIIREPVE